MLLITQNYIKVGKLQSAGTILKKLLNDGIKHSDLFYLLGELNRKTYHREQAKEYYRIGLRFEKFNIQIYLGYGIVLMEERNYKQALINFKQYLSASDSNYNADALYYSSVCHFNLNCIDQSLLSIEHALKQSWTKLYFNWKLKLIKMIDNQQPYASKIR